MPWNEMDSSFPMPWNEMDSSTIVHVNDEELARTVRVFGLPAGVDIEELQNFFENDSSGGPADEVTIYWLLREADIVFEKVEDAEKVSCTKKFHFKNTWLTAERVGELHCDMMTDHADSSDDEDEAFASFEKSGRSVLMENMTSMPLISTDNTDSGRNVTSSGDQVMDIDEEQPQFTITQDPFVNCKINDDEELSTSQDQEVSFEIAFCEEQITVPKVEREVPYLSMNLPDTNTSLRFPEPLTSQDQEASFEVAFCEERITVSKVEREVPYSNMNLPDTNTSLRFPEPSTSQDQEASFEVAFCEEQITVSKVEREVPYSGMKLPDTNTCLRFPEPSTSQDQEASFEIAFFEEQITVPKVKSEVPYLRMILPDTNTSLRFPEPSTSQDQEASFEIAFCEEQITVSKVEREVPYSGMKLPDTDTCKRFPDLQCGCTEPWYTGCFFDDVHLGFICQSCWKEWLLEGLADHTDEPPVYHDGKRYFSPQWKSHKESAQSQVTTSREKVETLSAADSLKPGDHIMWHRSWLIWHHAIVESVQDDRVNLFHFSNDKLATSVLKSEEFDFVNECGTFYLVVYSDEVCHKNPVELVLARARALLGITDYNIVEKNHENFATFCKTGNKTNQQKKWFLEQLKETFEELYSGPFHNVLHNCVEVFRPKVSDMTALGMKLEKKTFGGIGTGVVFAVEGLTFICNLDEIYRKRKGVLNDGTQNLSREEFISDVVQALSMRFFGYAVTHAVRLPAISIPGVGPILGSILSLIGGTLALPIGRIAGKPLGPVIARTITKAIKTTNESVALEKLRPGDHVVFYGNFFHPQCHAIVSQIDIEKGTLIVIRSSYKHQSIIYHKLLYKKNGPILKVCYCKKTTIYPADAIIKRAEKAIGDSKKHNIFNTCQDFVYSITLKC